jgi:hypothetical protein
VRRLLAIAIAVLVFVAIAAVLARWLSAENDERAKVTDLLQAQARGDERAMLAQIDGCLDRPACVGTVAHNARTLRNPGKLEIVAYDSATRHTLGAASGPTRVVWKAPGRLPTVQCVAIRRTGNVLSGPSITVTGISEAIDREGPC